MSRKAAPQNTPAPHGGKRPKAGRPKLGRTSQPPKIKPEAMEVFRRIAAARKGTVAEAIEFCAPLGLEEVKSRTVITSQESSTLSA